MGQSHFEDLVTSAVEQISTVGDAFAANKFDACPKVYDKLSKKWLLVNTGAACSVFLRSFNMDAKLDNSRALKAVNRSYIPTFAKTTVTLNLGPRTYKHEVTIAHIDTPILGWDFLLKFKIDVRWHTCDKCSLFDQKQRTAIPLQIQKVNKDILDLAVITTSLKSWSQQQSASHNQRNSTCPFPSAYQKILNDFPTINKVDFTIMPKHNIVRTIDTKNHPPPCKARVRQIMPNSR